MLWGTSAQKKRPLIDETRHLVLCANHPSPLSALRGPEPFIGSGHFSKAQKWCMAIAAGSGPSQRSPNPAQGRGSYKNMA